MPKPGNYSGENGIRTTEWGRGLTDGRRTQNIEIKVKPFGKAQEIIKGGEKNSEKVETI